MADARPQRALSALSGRFQSRDALALQVEHTGDGTLASALDAGITSAQMPEGDEELAGAWKLMAGAYATFRQHAGTVEDLLDE